MIDWLRTLTLVVLLVSAAPACQAGAAEAAKAGDKAEATESGAKANGQAPATATSRSLVPLPLVAPETAWTRLLQVFAGTGIPLEGLIKPERMGMDVRGEASGNETSLFTGNSVRGDFSIFTGVSVHLNVTVQVTSAPDAKRKEAPDRGRARRAAREESSRKTRAERPSAAKGAERGEVPNEPPSAAVKKRAA